MNTVTLLTFTVLGLGPVPIIYWLVQKARAAGLIKSKKVAFLAPGAVWALLIVLWYFAQSERPPLWQAVLIWLGGWVLTMLFKAGVKDNERAGGQV